MKLTVILALALALAGLAASQNLSGEPACATSCLSSAISKAGCQLADQACQCGPTQSVIGSLVAPCLVSNCNGTDLAVAASVGSQLCAEFSSALTASSTAAPPSTSSGTGPVTTTSTTTPSTSSTPLTSPTTGGGNTATSNGTTTTGGSAAGAGSPGGIGGGGGAGGNGGGAATTSSSTTGFPVSGNLAAAATPAIIGALAALMGVVAAM